jgi:hypothetical protein
MHVNKGLGGLPALMSSRMVIYMVLDGKIYPAETLQEDPYTVE